jgi:acyl-CoA synthetase (NDP forming)
MDVYSSLDKCPEPIDLAGIVVPPYAVVDSVKQAIENDIRAAAIITAGFGEVKSDERQDENRELVRVANDGGLIFVGPNSMGLYTSHDRSSPLHLGFGFMMPRPGNLSIVSQSGTMGSILGSTLEKIRYFVSSGNEASLTLEDYLEFYARDEETKVIALFAEGLRAGKRFKEICLETTKKKPIIFLKAGLTKTGARAANSHTGSIAGELNIYKSVFDQTGVIFTDSIMEYIYLIKGAQYLLPLPNSDRIRAGIISGGGGFVVHLTDLCERQGINVVDLRTEPNGPKLIEDISKLLPFYWSHNNPVDMVATNDETLYRKVIDLMLDSDCFDVLFTMTNASFRDRIESMRPINEYGERLKQMMLPVLSKRMEETIENEINVCLNHPDKRIIYISFGSGFRDPVYDRYDDNKIMVISGDLDFAPKILRKLHKYQKFINSTSKSTK